MSGMTNYLNFITNLTSYTHSDAFDSGRFSYYALPHGVCTQYTCTIVRSTDSSIIVQVHSTSYYGVITAYSYIVNVCTHM